MEWKPESITENEREKKQTDYIKMAIEMAKRASIEIKPPPPAEKPAVKAPQVVVEKKLNVSKTIEINAVLDIDGEDTAEEELEEEIIEDIEEELAVEDSVLPEEVVTPEEEHIQEIIEEENEVTEEAQEPETTSAPFEDAEPCECPDKPERKRISSEPPNFDNFVKEHNRRTGRSAPPGRPSNAGRSNTQSRSNTQNRNAAGKDSGADTAEGSFSWQDFKKN